MRPAPPVSIMQERAGPSLPTVLPRAQHEALLTNDEYEPSDETDTRDRHPHRAYHDKLVAD